MPQNTRFREFSNKYFDFSEFLIDISSFPEFPNDIFHFTEFPNGKKAILNTRTERCIHLRVTIGGIHCSWRAWSPVFIPYF